MPKPKTQADATTRFALPYRSLIGLLLASPLLCSPLRRMLLFIVITLLAVINVLDTRYPLSIPNNQALYAHVVVDSKGHPLRSFPDKRGVWRYAVTLEDISPLYLEALLTYEDRRFWYHPGIDPFALVRAAASNLRNQRIVSGGSTLSMQVARLLHPHSRSIGGKFYQILRTLQLEWHLSKREILTLYCNIAPFGGTIEGVQAASYSYLNKSASQLTAAEAALLTVLPQSPTRYRPDLHPEAAQQARNKVLGRMVSLRVWDQQTIDSAKLENVFSQRLSAERHAPLLSRRLLQQAKHQATGGQVIHTTIDGELQRSLEDTVRDYIEGHSGGVGTKTSAAVVVVNNLNAEVLAYIGTAEFANPKRFGHVDMVQALRSPGSTLKPFLYAMALDEGLIHSHSLLSDTPHNWHHYRPGNFSGGFSGPVSVSEALQRSLNVPAVLLLEKLGPNNFAARLQNAGLALEIPGNKANLSIILGGAGTNLESLVTAFAAFANQGQTRALRYLQNDSSNTSTASNTSRYLMSPQAAWVSQNILSGVPRPNAISGTSALEAQQKMAWKTGTSYGFRDSWAIGVDRLYTIGVWVGRPDGTPSPGASGRSHAGPLLHAIADHLPQSRQAIKKPIGLQQVPICWPLGTAREDQAQAFCQQHHLAWIIDGNIPPNWPDPLAPLATNPRQLYINPQNGHRVNAHCMTPRVELRQVALWPRAMEPWLPNRLRRRQQLPPLAEHCQPALGDAAPIKISSIDHGAIIRTVANNTQPPAIPLQANGGEGKLHWYINGVFHRSAQPASKLLYQLKQQGKKEIVVIDDAGNTDRVMIQFQ